jgi:hypothetical protein
VSKHRALGKLPIIPDEVYKRLARVRPMEGPRCYICGRLFREGDRKFAVAVGPGQDRSHFREASQLEREGISALPSNIEDSVYVGAECVRRYVPKESIICEGRR